MNNQQQKQMMKEKVKLPNHLTDDLKRMTREERWRFFLMFLAEMQRRRNATITVRN